MTVEISTVQHSTPATEAKRIRIPSLDGLRAISILLVLIGHLSYTAGFHYWIFEAYAHAGVLVLPRALNHQVMVWIGTLSYSLYLWQMLWMNPARHMETWARVGLTFAWAAVSYYGLERPVLALRNKRVPLQKATCAA